MAQYIRSAWEMLVQGVQMITCWRLAPDEEEPMPCSIDRYFERVGGYLVGARNRFEREYVEGVRVGF